MESIYQRALGAELERIEQEAANQSMAIIAQADTLADATDLCERINAMLPDDLKFEPTVVYYGSGKRCNVIIYTQDRGSALLCSAADLGLSWTDHGECWGDMHKVRVDAYPAVEIIVETTELAWSRQPVKAAE